MGLRTFVRITRIPFVTADIVPVLLGGLLAWGDGELHPGYLFLTLIGAVCINLGLNMSNDYFDHLSGTDAANAHPTPFSGGSRVIQEGVASPGRVLGISIFFYLVGILIGLYLAWARGWIILALGIVAVFICFFHNAPPFRLYYLGPGVGELLVGLGFGPLMVFGSYYVQAQRFSLGALWASLPVGALIAAVLYINQFPDCEADRTVGKKTTPVVLGRERAARGFVAIVAATYIIIVLGIVLGLLSPWLGLALLTLPLAYTAARGALRFHSNLPALVPVMAATIQIHLLTGLLLCLGSIVARFS
jgi:1,4-dihydroxy-2-naphthoate octaprenyltransferase